VVLHKFFEAIGILQQKMDDNVHNNFIGCN